MGQRVVRAGQVAIRRAPWKWLRTCVGRLLAPIDFESVGYEREHSSRPEELAFPGARLSVGAGDSVATACVPIGSIRSKDAALTLCNGRSIHVRSVHPADAEEVQEFVRRLSDTSRRLRFFAPIRELTPTMLAHLTGSASRRGPVLIAESHEGATSCIC